MSSASIILSTDNELFAAYLFYTAVLAIKIMLMAPLTAIHRYRKRVFANPEDAKLPHSKIKFDDPDVERVRRAHLNDLENIPIFFAVGFAYVLTNPAAGFAINLFRAFTAARIVHTIVYAVVVIPQPARGISFFVAAAVNCYMAVSVVMKLM